MRPKSAPPEEPRATRRAWRAAGGCSRPRRVVLLPFALVVSALLLLSPGARSVARAGGGGLAAPPTAAFSLADQEWSFLPEGATVYVANNFRWERWAFFDPAPPGGDPTYGYVANRLRFGLRMDRPHWGFHTAGQYVQLGSLPDDAAGMPGGALGTGPLYFGHAGGEKSPGSISLKYLNLELRDLFDSGLSLTLGRFGYASGTEAKAGVPKIDLLKKMRVADRLIGEFGWSHFQRSFDGARLDWEHAFGHLSAAAFRPTQGGFENSANRTMNDVGVFATSYTVKPEKLVPGAELQGFYYLYDDERPVTARTDNTGLMPTPKQDIRIHTFGGHAAAAYKAGEGEVDLLVWGALQRGKWFESEHRAGAVALEAGYQFTGTPWKPWIRTGWFGSSGDGFPSDRDHETFFQILPTARLYSLTTAYNLMNNSDAFIELIMKPHPRLTLRSGVRDLRLMDRNDRWYVGAGATQEEGAITGYAGRPSNGHRHLGTAAEFMALVKLTDFLKAHVYYGHIWGGNVVRPLFADDDGLDFFYLELTFSAKARRSAAAP